MRYTHDPPLSATLTVRMGLLGEPSTRFVTLRHALLRVHASVKQPDASDNALRVADARDLDIDEYNETITVRGSTPWWRCGVTLCFSGRAGALPVWETALRRAFLSRLSRFYDVGMAVGRGHFATVRAGTDVRTGEQVAVKSVWKPGSTAQAVRREAALARGLKPHRNVVRFLDVFETDVQLHLVMELVPGGDLFDLVEDAGHHTEVLARHVVTQLLHALAHLHAHGVVHRDVKPENVLLGADLSVKLADFGLSRRLGRDECGSSASSASETGEDDSDESQDSSGEEDDSVRTPSSDGSCDALDEDPSMSFCSDMDYTLRSAVGTPAFCAPEIIRRKPYGRPVDIFALGVLACFVMTGRSPFAAETARDTLLNVDKALKSFPKLWDSVSENGQDFVHRLTARQPEDRPTAAEALLHPWICGSSKDTAALPGQTTPGAEEEIVLPVVDDHISGKSFCDVPIRRLSTLSQDSVVPTRPTDQAPVEEFFGWM